MTQLMAQLMTQLMTQVMAQLMMKMTQLMKKILSLSFLLMMANSQQLLRQHHQSQDQSLHLLPLHLPLCLRLHRQLRYHDPHHPRTGQSNF